MPAPASVTQNKGRPVNGSVVAATAPAKPVARTLDNALPSPPGAGTDENLDAVAASLQGSLCQREDGSYGRGRLTTVATACQSFSLAACTCASVRTVSFILGKSAAAMCWASARRPWSARNSRYS